jgi:S-adenosylmethionine:tRNA ribosyltransferase-isomerase
MRVDAFDFDLPEHLIALRPVEPRDAARLLVHETGMPPADKCFYDLPALLRPSDVLVINDTKVIPAQLTATKPTTGAKVHVTLHKRETADTWRAFARPAKKLKIGDQLSFGGANKACAIDDLAAIVAAKGEGGEITLKFDYAGPVLDEAIHALGAMPLPPYIAGRRTPDRKDVSDYQTVYAEPEGAVAAPTAGLHFTKGLIDRIAEIGAEIIAVTLHVGAGTFLPVKADHTEDHKMHAEWGEISPTAAARINQAKQAGGRLIAVGTTALRLLEAAADDNGEIRPFTGETDIFITPGYRFRAVDMLVTNFHLPRSTLFMLIAAFCGLDNVKRLYAHAIAKGYRFYSYGDACLLQREAAP